ncbi:MAG TPA: nuclear transport factor 2 family protein [Dehalococcoidia bacterium]|nr:nuclear transport factor 2 family protein [Dehalococcoidia bacterium]
MDRFPELETIIRNWFEAVSNKDASWIDRHLSAGPDLRIIGTDPHEWLKGEAAANLLHTDLEVLGGTVKFDVGETEAYRDGNVAWGCASFTIMLPNGGHVSPRWTGVFRQEDGNWKAVHIHASIGLSNEQAFNASF